MTAAETKQLPAKVLASVFNEKTRMLGLENSNFLVPDGHDTEGQYTTAYDLVIIVKACLDDPYISEIVSSYTSYPKWVGGREVTYNNSNEPLNPNSQYYYPEVIGLKTEASTLAGNCLVSVLLPPQKPGEGQSVQGRLTLSWQEQSHFYGLALRY